MTVSVLVVAALLGAAQTTPTAPAKTKPPAAEPAAKATPAPAAPLPHVEAGGVRVTYRRLPWNPTMFGIAERGHAAAPRVVDGETMPSGPYRADVSAAQMDTEVPVTLDGVRLDPGSYVLVVQPSREGRKMGLQWRRVAPGTRLRPGQFTQIPAGDVVLERPASWDPAPEPTPVLKASLLPVAGGLRLVLDYGDRRLSLDLRL
jgi:hypothetical protein